MVIEVNNNYAGILFQSQDILDIAKNKDVQIKTVGDVIGMLENDIPGYIQLIEVNTPYRITENCGQLNVQCLSLSGGSFCMFIINGNAPLNPAECFSYVNGKLSKIGENDVKNDEKEQLFMLSFAKAAFFAVQEKIKEDNVEESYGFEEENEYEDDENDEYEDNENEELTEDDVLTILDEIARVINESLEENMNNIQRIEDKKLYKGSPERKTDYIKNKKNQSQTIKIHLVVGGTLDNLILYTKLYKNTLLPFMTSSSLVKKGHDYYKLIMDMDLTRDEAEVVAKSVNSSLEFVDLITNPKNELGQLMVEKDAYQGLLIMGE